MRIQQYESRKQTDCVFALADSNNDGANFFTVIVGENGVGKSRLLRDIFDTVFRSVTRASLFDGLGVVEDSFGKVTLLRDPMNDFRWPPPHIIALSGVATDKFPNKRSLASRNGSKFDSNQYLYCGPKSENGMVSRNLSERQLCVEILRNMHHVDVRRKAIAAPFELFPQAKGAVFETVFDDRAGRSEPKNLSDFKKRIDEFFDSKFNSRISQAGSDPTLWDELDQLRDNPELLQICFQILRNKAEFTWQFSNAGELDRRFSDIERLAFRLMVSARLVRVQGALLMPKDEKLLFENLSSGQWQVFSSIMLVAFAVQDDALLLVDEPENSLHPAWQQMYLPSLSRAMASVHGVHTIVATHSPLVAASVHPDVGSVCAVKRTAAGHLHAGLLERTTFGWSSDDILQEVFGLASSRSVDFRRDLDDALKLIGKGDVSNKKLRAILTRLNSATATLPEMDTIREVVATMNALAAEQ